MVSNFADPYKLSGAVVEEVVFKINLLLLQSLTVLSFVYIILWSVVYMVLNYEQAYTVHERPLSIGCVLKRLRTKTAFAFKQ
jgi:hypothetical protein